MIAPQFCLETLPGLRPNGIAIMKTLLRTFVGLLFIASLSAAEFRVASPDGEVALVLSLDARGTPRYRVTYHGRPVVLDSRLGFEAAEKSQSLLDDFEVAGTHERREDTSWKPVYGERATIPDRFHELIVELRHRPTGARLDLVARAYDEGAALRYAFPSAPGAPANHTFTAERTEFAFPPDTDGYEEHGTEGDYARVPIAKIKKDCERPLTVAFADGRFASLIEAALDRYPRMLLSPSPFTPGALASALSGPATISRPAATPWRAFIVGDRPGDLLERNHLVLNLNPPCALADTSWIKPGKAIREVSLSTPGGIACIDFAVAHGFRYILYDAGWYGHEYDDHADARGVHLDQKRVGHVANHPGLDLAAVIAYGKKHGIGVFLYVNRRALERQFDELFPLYEKWGVAGVKFGFVNVGAQEWTTWVHDGVRKAAAHHLLVDIHDSYRPSGFTRTYPNLLTQEGVRGNEHFPTATHNATLPFTRAPAGPADYTICIYSPRLKNTRAHQLALAVTGYSPLQLMYWYDRPDQFDGAPELAFLDHVPTVWDDTRVVSGKIGEHATVARRSGDAWFVGTITGDEARTLTTALTFLPAGRKYTAQIYESGDTPGATRVRTETVTSSSVLRAALPAAGGQEVRLTPVNAFFAMDNIARGGPDVVPTMIGDLGYDGYGGRALDELMPAAMAGRGLKFFNGYHVITLDPAQPAPNEKLRAWLAAMRGQDTALWLAINKVNRADGKAHAVSSPEADDFVVAEVRAIAAVAASHGVRVALYPHTGFWLARVEDALRVADKINRPDVGVTFNLCHWLKVEGAERDPVPVLRAALPRLMFVTISGADTGDTKKSGWDRLIQPLDAGSYDLGSFVRTVRAVGYTGPFGFQGYNIKAEPRDVLARSMAAWRKFTAD